MQPPKDTQICPKPSGKRRYLMGIMGSQRLDEFGGDSFEPDDNFMDVSSHEQSHQEDSRPEFLKVPSSQFFHDFGHSLGLQIKEIFLKDADDHFEFEGGDEADDNYNSPEQPKSQRKKRGDRKKRDNTQSNVMGTLLKRSLTRNAKEMEKQVLVESDPKIKQTMDFNRNWKELYISEPNSLGQKLQAIIENLFEILMMLASIGISLKRPSLVAIFFIVLNQSVLQSASLEPISRLKWALRFVIFNSLLLVAIMLWKATHYKNLETSFQDHESYHMGMVSCEAKGFFLYDRVEDGENHNFSFKIDADKSFEFEKMLSGIYLITLVLIINFMGKIQFLEDQKVDLILVRNFYFNQDSDSDDGQQVMDIGMDSERRKQMVEAGKKRQYKSHIQKLSKTLPQNFLGCSFFKKLNKQFFILMVIFLLCQSMGYNGLSDAPQLALLLSLCALFAFKESYPVTFGLSIFFIVYYVQFALTLKVIYGIISQIDSVEHLMEEFKSDSRVKMAQMLFGCRFADHATNMDEFEFQKSVYYGCLLVCITMLQAWKQAKWIDIQHVYQEKKLNGNLLQVLKFYLTSKVITKSFNEKIQAKFKLKKKIKDRIKNMRKRKVPKKTQALNIDKKDLYKFLPTIMIWVLRISLTFQSYMYHDKRGLFNLLFVLASFILKIDLTLMYAIIIMIPTYSVQFMFIYASRIPGMEDIAKLSDKIGIQGDITAEMHMPVGEQFLYFFNLALFFLCISCYWIQFKNNQNRLLVDLFIDKVTDRHASIAWKFLFFALKYIHWLVLFLLCWRGANNLNHFKNLGFMTFFVIYTLSEYAYRKTCKILVVFVAFFIIGQYYFSITYKSYYESPESMKRLTWYGLLKADDVKVWLVQEPKCYFNYIPNKRDWLILIAMSILNFINLLFQDPEKDGMGNTDDLKENGLQSPGRNMQSDDFMRADQPVKKKVTRSQLLSIECYEKIRDRFPSAYLTIVSINNAVKQYIVVIVLAIIFSFLRQAQSNLVNSILFILNILLSTFLIKGDGKESTHRISRALAYCLKFYSFFILVLEILFIAFIGTTDEEQKQNYFGVMLTQNYPELDRRLEFIGFKIQARPGEKLSDERILYMMKFKFVTYIAYFLIAEFLISYFDDKISKNNGFDQFTEEGFKKIFEFKKQTGKVQDVNEEEIIANIDENDFRSQAIQRKLKFERRLRISQEKGRIVEKEEYFENDFLELYEQVRHTSIFKVYKMIDYWPIFDVLANYGHIINNLLTVVTAIYFNVSFFLWFNVICVCFFYSVTIVRLNRQAEHDFKASGLLHQTSLKVANILTKSYKIGAFQESLRVRKILWRLQLVMVVLACCLGFPTTLLSLLRNKLEFENQTIYQGQPYHQASIDQIDWWMFYIFMAGIYKDDRVNVESYFYVTMFILAIGLTIERQAINWLSNRYGCNYNRFQKCIELDLRKQSIGSESTPKWPISPPEYNIDNYKFHYLGIEFDILKQRFQENAEHQLAKSQSSFKFEQSHGHFISYKLAVKLKRLITFTVKLKGRCQDLNLDESTIQILNEIDQHQKLGDSKDQHHQCQYDYSDNSDSDIALGTERIQTQYCEYDYESVAILKDYKIKELALQIKEAIDRKYKISFHRGVQIAYESLIILILMISVVLKSNVLSLVYMLFIFRFLTSNKNSLLFVHLAVFISITFVLQYFLLVVNLIERISPVKYPTQFTGYPNNGADEKFLFPLFFKFHEFRDLRLVYLVGIIIEQKQISVLFIDFIILYLINIYIYHYRNPILYKSVHKIFWRFPAFYEPKEIWDRVHKDVKRQVNWLFNPKSLSHPQYDEIRERMSSYEKEIANDQLTMALEHNRLTKVDYDQILINYIDLAENDIWSTATMKRVKKDFKQQSVYFRLVKQGSVVIYLCFHIFTILFVLFMATLRQSIIALGYVLIVISTFNIASDVLMQRNFHQDKYLTELKKKVERLEYEIQMKDYETQTQGHDHCEKSAKEEYNQMLKELKDAKDEQSRIKQENRKKPKDLKEDERRSRSQKGWKMIDIIKHRLLVFACFDFIIQIIFQMPVFKHNPAYELLGFRKVWKENAELAMEYERFISDVGGDQSGYDLIEKNLLMQCLNCMIICMISLQVQIFSSPGYIKFITQQNGSMDLLVKLSHKKAQSISFVFNNHKIRKIVSIQRKRETIFATVEKLKTQLKKWRMFSRQILDPKQYKKDDDFQPVSPSYDMPSKRKSGVSFGDDQAQQNEDGDFTPKVRKTSLDFNLESLKTQKEHGSITEIESKDPELDLKPQQKSKTQFEENDGDMDKFIRKKRRISSERANELFKKLVPEFVQAKKQKLNAGAKLYLFLNQTFSQLILFKNEEDELDKIVQTHSQGEVYTPTELEQIMYDESLFLIQKHYDHVEGTQELFKLIAKFRGKNNLNKRNQGKSMLQVTNLDKKIKLSQMPRTWEFTRPRSLALKLLETLAYMIISNTQNLTYFCMILSMYMNAGMISLLYPIAVFGYAMIEETRPRKEFWRFIRSYTTGLLFFKFIVNLSILGPVMETDLFIFLQGYMKIGIFDYEDIWSLFVYMLPEILILVFSMLNELQLKLIGLYYLIEEDLESIHDGIQRNIEKGDTEKVNLKKQFAASMYLRSYFWPLETQIKHNQMAQQQNIDADGDGDVDTADQFIPNKANQEAALKEASIRIYNCSRRFDIDQTSDSRQTVFDEMVQNNVLQKSLESDDLLYVEGYGIQQVAEFSKEEIHEEIAEEQKLESISNGDFPEEIEVKLQNINAPSAKGLFEKINYFDKLFPSLKIQKPGVDLYGSTTVFQSILAIFVFLNYSKMSVDQTEYLSSLKESNSIFQGEMAVVLIFVIIIIIIERYVNRSDTKAINQNSETSSMTKQDGFFKKDEMFQKNARAFSNRPDTVRVLKTMKTSDIDMQDNSAQDFLQSVYGNDDGGNKAFDQTRTKITEQQKTKFVLHWIILITSHVFIFWYIPISGNVQLYGNSECDTRYKKQYGCKDFHDNPTLRKFYILVCVVLGLSALQMRYGFTIMKKASSVLQYHDNPLALIGAQVFMAIPFATEIRCLLDFTFSKTSLDIFQFWQLFQYHIELYCAKNGNVSYVVKVLGSRTPMLDKCIFGVIISSVILGMLIGPIFFFSDYGGFIAPNPALSGEIDVSLIIDKTTSIQQILQNEKLRGGGEAENQGIEIPQDADDKWKEQYQAKELHAQVPYEIYCNKYPFFRQYDDEFYSQTPFSKWTETRFFQANQLQDCIANEYSEGTWQLSERGKTQLYKDLVKAVDPNDKDYNMELSIGYKFTRELPDLHKTAKSEQVKRLNLEKLPDCLTAKDLKKVAELDCSPGPDGTRSTASASVRFSQVYVPNIVLGASDSIGEIIREGDGLTDHNQMHDINITFVCDDQWIIHASKESTNIDHNLWNQMAVDPETCIAKGQDKNSPELEEWIKQWKNNDDVIWHRVKLTLFSMMVSASIFAGFDVTTFYTTVVLVLGSQLRPIFLYGTWRGWVYETTHPDAILKLIEAVYIKRHEEDLIGEEECYRMLAEIIRSPELLKAISGSSLKGTVDPCLDRLSKADRQKIEHLEILERKGFDVEKLKQQILSQNGPQEI